MSLFMKSLESIGKSKNSREGEPLVNHTGVWVSSLVELADKIWDTIKNINENIKRRQWKK